VGPRGGPGAKHGRPRGSFIPSRGAENQGVRFCARLKLFSRLGSFFCNSAKDPAPPPTLALGGKGAYTPYGRKSYPTPPADAAASMPPAPPDAATRAAARRGRCHDLSLPNPIVEGAGNAVLERHRGRCRRDQAKSGGSRPESAGESALSTAHKGLERAILYLIVVAETVNPPERAAHKLFVTPLASRRKSGMEGVWGRRRYDPE